VARQARPGQTQHSCHQPPFRTTPCEAQIWEVTFRQDGSRLRKNFAPNRIAAAVGISRYTVAEYLRRAAVVGITLPVPPELDDAALERKLFTPPGFIAAETTRPQPRLQPPENHALVGEEPRHLRRNAHPRKQSRDSTWILAQSIIDPCQRFVEGVDLGG
jgi:hypothetical protein